jgi:hypothetical protein
MSGFVLDRCYESVGVSFCSALAAILHYHFSLSQSGLASVCFLEVWSLGLVIPSHSFV